ncbi:MAG: hypothetical protein ABI885_09655, partial [Gammaproteobacteria bacterium]
MSAHKTKRARRRKTKHLPPPNLTDQRDELNIIAATIAVVQTALRVEDDNWPLALTMLEHVMYPLEAVRDAL